jgi:hypothetical protein
MSDEFTFEDFKKVIMSEHSPFGDAEDRLLRKAAQMDDEEEAKQFLIAHIDELGPVFQESIREAMLGEIEVSMRKEEIMAEAHALFDAALKDVEWYIENIPVEDVKEGTPTLITGFINEYLGRNHSVEAVKAALNGLNVWYRGE